MHVYLECAAAAALAFCSDRPNPDRGIALSSPNVLLVDDNADVAKAISVLLTRAEIAMAHAHNPEQAYSMLAHKRFDAILLDLNFTPDRRHGEEGLACLTRVLSDDPDAAVVVITAHSGIRIAIAAMRAGALDFVMKPWRNDELLERVQAAIAERHRRQDVRTPCDAGEPPDGQPRLLGECPAIVRTREVIRKIGPTSASVIVTGPSGTGRSLVARAVHAASSHAGRPMVSVDVRDEVAWPRITDSGESTLVLRHVDQITDIEQLRLLDRLPRRARLVSTAETLMGISPALKGRLATIEIALPPLSARGDDVLLLARHFARVAAHRHDRPASRLTGAAEAMLTFAAWPDEVRGLELAIERAVLLANGDLIDASSISPAAISTIGEIAGGMPETLRHSEKALVESALQQHSYNVSRAADALGVSRAALYRRMAKHGL